MGYAPEERIGKNISESGLLHPEDLAEKNDVLAEAIRSPGTIVTEELRMQHQYGSWRYIEATVRSLLDDPNVGGVVVNARDITERKEAEEKLRYSEEKYRLLMKQASDGVFIGDREGNFVEVNPKACEMLGYTREELLRLDLKDVIAAEDLDEIPLRLDELTSGKTLVIERRLRRGDGTLLPVETSARMLDDGRLYANVRDITERKRAEEALQKSERSLAAAQQIAHVGSWEYDVEKDEARWSDEAYRIFGFSPQQLVPTRRKHLEFVHPEDRGLVERSMLDPSRKEEQPSIEYRIIRPNGEVRILQNHYEVDFDETGKLVGVTGTVQDVTKPKALE